jgi:hypothetical protein
VKEGIGFARAVKRSCERFVELLAVEMSKVMGRDFLVEEI